MRTPSTNILSNFNVACDVIYHNSQTTRLNIYAEIVFVIVHALEVVNCEPQNNPNNLYVYLVSSKTSGASF